MASPDRKRARRNGGRADRGPSWVAVLGGAVVAAFVVREFVQKPIDRARGVSSP